MAKKEPLTDAQALAIKNLLVRHYLRAMAKRLNGPAMPTTNQEEQS